MGCIGEILCCVVVFTVVTVSSFAKSGGVWIFYCVSFLVPFRFSCCMRVDFKLLILVLSGRNEL